MICRGKWRWGLRCLGVILTLVVAACGTRITGEQAGTNGGAGSGVTSGTANGSTGATTATSKGSKNGSDGSVKTGPSDPGVTDTEIRVGASGPLSGVIAFAGAEAFGAIDSYFRLVNSQGGVNGRKLKLVTYDNRMDTPTDLANIRKLYEEDKVISLMLLFADPTGDYVTRHKIPTLIFGVTPAGFASKWPTVYPLVGNALLWTQEVVAGLKQQNLMKPNMRVGILYDTQFLDMRQYVPFLKEAWENAGAKVVSTDAFNFADGDCTSLVLKMKQLEVDWWDFQGLGWVLCASAAQRQNYRPKVGWGSWATSVGGLTTQVGPWVEGMWGGVQGDQPTGRPRFDVPQSGHKEYADSIKKYHPDLATENHLESPVTIGYWSGAKLLVEAIRAQGKQVTMKGINDWIAKVENFDTGITPPIISMAPNCKTGSELVWIGRWRWDAAKKVAYRTPESDYLSSDQKDRYGGKCFLTKISDSFD